MRIAVIGGTGTIGRRIVTALVDGGHDVRGLSRSAAEYPVDLTSGAGLDQALRGCDVVVDASNGPPSPRARAVLVDGARRLLEAERGAGGRPAGPDLAAGHRPARDRASRPPAGQARPGAA